MLASNIEISSEKRKVSFASKTWVMNTRERKIKDDVQ
jgi:hypothetical protein